jgi:hypothetical protein
VGWKPANWRRLHRLERAQERDERFQIVVRHARIKPKGHHGDDSTAVAANPLGGGVGDLLIRPGAQASLFVGGQVGAVHGAEGNRKSSATRMLRPFRIAVTSASACDGENILSLRDQLFTVHLRVGRHRNEQCDGQKEQ